MHLYEFLHVSKALARNVSDVPVQTCSPGQKFCRVDVDPDQFANIMTCANSNSSFKLFGQSIYFDWSNDKGFQWGNIEAFWGKDKNSGTKGWRFEVKEEFTIAGGFGAVVEAKFGDWPITFIVEWQWEYKFDLPAIYSCNTWWGQTLSSSVVAGVYLKPFEWTASAKQACPWGLLLTA